jgi:hypothetical protein
VSGLGRLELAGYAIAFGLDLVARPAARFKVVDRGWTVSRMGFDMIILGFESVSAVDTPDAIEVGRVPEFQRQQDFDRCVARPPAHLAKVFSVVEQPGQEASWAISRATCGETGPTPGILQTSPLRTFFQPRLATSWLTKTTNSGRRARPLVVAVRAKCLA